MITLALSSETLQRLSYHEIWGLRVDIPGVKTLYEEAQHLHASAELRQSMIRETDAILQGKGLYGWVIRGFCWLFNWNQYRVNYYNLQGYFAWQTYEQGIKMLPTAQQTAIKQTGVFRVDYVPADGVLRTALSYINPVPVFIWAGSGLTWISSGLMSLLVGNNELETVDCTSLSNTNDAEPTSFNVNEQMLAPLAILGIQVLPLSEALRIEGQIAQPILLEDLKRSYRDSLLRTHPDRPQGNQAEFIEVKDAYDALLALIKAASNPNQDICGLAANLEKYKAAMQEKFEKARRENKSFGEDVAAYGVKVTAYSEGVTELSAGVIELSAGVTELSAGVTDYTRRVDLHLQETAELAAEISQLLAEVRAQNIANGTLVQEDETHDVPPESSAENPQRLFTRPNSPLTSQSDENTKSGSYTKK